MFVRAQKSGDFVEKLSKIFFTGCVFMWLEDGYCQIILNVQCTVYRTVGTHAH